MELEWLNYEQRQWIQKGKCPDCHGQLLKGPEGGLSINVMCWDCGHKFNICEPIGTHRIH